MNLTVVAAALLLGILLGGALMWLGQRRRSPRAAAPDGDLRALRTRLQMLESSAVGVGQRLDRVVEELRAVKQRQDNLESRSSSTIAYEQAIRLAQNGRDLERLIQAFGVSRAEAELLRKLHPEAGTAASSH